MSDATGSRREIGWNAVQLSCPTKWESIVMGESHLLFEEDFQPVLELRWLGGKKKARQSVQGIAEKLQRESGLSPLQGIPPSWQELRNNYAIQLLASGKEPKQARAALLTCQICQTTFLLFFFEQLPVNHPHLGDLLSSLKCHDRENTRRLWSVQDFRLLLPATFQLTSHSFAAGLTRLSYRESGLTMHLCRLSSAAQRLEKSGLADMMISLSGAAVAREEVQPGDHMVSHVSHPSLFSQIISRCKRRAPFHHMTLRHHPGNDRLSGLFFFDKKPIPEGTVKTIIDSYAFLTP